MAHSGLAARHVAPLGADGRFAALGSTLDECKSMCARNDLRGVRCDLIYANACEILESLAMRALVTGGTRGIGLAVGQALSAAGHEVVATYAHDDAAARA